VCKSRVQNTLQSTIGSLVGVEDLDHQDLVGGHARSVVPFVSGTTGRTQGLVALGHFLSSVATVISGSTSVDGAEVLSRRGPHVANGQGVLADRLDGSPNIDNAPATFAETNSVFGTDTLVKELLSAKGPLVNVCEVSGSNLANAVIVTESSLLNLLGDLLPRSTANDVREDVDMRCTSTATSVSQ
jgi:hypothetical protein